MFSLAGFRFFEQQRQLFTIVMRTKDLGKRRAMEEDALYWSLVNKMALVLDDGVQQGLFRPLDPMKVAGMLLDAQGALILQQLMGKSTNTAQENVRLVMDVFLNGIRTQPEKI